MAQKARFLTSSSAWLRGEKTPLCFEFPYVCPEPVLANLRFLAYTDGARETLSYLGVRPAS